MAKTKYIKSNNKVYVEATAYSDPSGYERFWVVNFESTLFEVGPDGAVVLRDLLNEIIKANKKEEK